ncbi:MAG: hypothetical protein HEQ39_01590 [Rhizobacter sp.]
MDTRNKASESIEPALLIAGGSRDTGICRLVAAAERRQCAFVACQFNPHQIPALSWDLMSDELLLQGIPVRPQALFLRHDVFNALSFDHDAVKQEACAQQADGWQATWRGWLLVHSEARVLNRGFLARVFSKPHQLVLAHRLGLRIPRTLIANDMAALRERAAEENCIVKPVQGGQFTACLSSTLLNCPADALASLMPAIVQSRLDGPEYRIFLIGDATLAFRVDSPLLDYRADQSCVGVTQVDVGMAAIAAVLQPLKALAGALGLDFCAADLKTDSGTGELVFLEVNEQPMFARFDQESGGQLCDAILDALLKVRTTAPTPPLREQRVPVTA